MEYELNKIYNEDCYKAIKKIPDNSIDLIVTDPPYKVTKKGCAGTMSGYWKDKLANDGKIFTYNNISCKDYLPEFYRVQKEGTILYLMCNNINLQEMINEGIKAGFHFVKSLIWEKGNKICGKYYMNCFEYILLFRKGKDRPINNCGTPDILKIPIRKLKDASGKNLHDTEKPVKLMKILIENSSNDNEIILDPFMGSGTTAVATKLVGGGRKFLGFEIDKKYYDIACDRLNGITQEDRKKKEEGQLTLF